MSNVAVSYNKNSRTNTYAITFEYDREEQVSVRTPDLDNAPEYIDVTNWEFDGPTNIKFIGDVPDTFEIVRTTDISQSFGPSKYSVFVQGSSIKASDLNGDLELLRLAIEENQPPEGEEFLTKVDLASVADEDVVTVTNTGGDDAVIPGATSTNAGVMTKDAFNLLSSLSTNSTNLGTSYTADNVVITNTTGTNATINPVTDTAAGIMTPEQLAKTGVSKIVAGKLISITDGDGSTSDGTGEVTINSDVTALSFEGNVDVTSNTVPGNARNATKQDLYLNTGQGKFSATWAAVTEDATTDTNALPGDYMVYNGSTWNHIPTGQAPVNGGFWERTVSAEGVDSLYPLTASDYVGIGTATPTSKLTVRSDLDNGVKKMLTLEGASPVPIEEGEPGAGAELFMTAHFGESRAGVIGVENVSGPPNQSHDMYFSTSNTSDPEERMRITYDGFVGIGTTTPPDLLSITSTDPPNISLTHSSVRHWKIGMEGTDSEADLAITDFTGSNTVAYFARTGNVGIGTTDPQATLHVQGPTANSLIANFGANNDAPERALKLNEFSADEVNSTGFQFNAPGKSDTGLGAAISLATQGTDRLYVNYLGNVGIGTTDPAHKLHIETTDLGNSVQLLTLLNKGSGNSGSGAKLFLSGTDPATRGAYIEGTVRNSGNGHALSFGTSPSGDVPVEHMRIDHTGNVGIGTTLPDHKLDVNGDLNATNYRIDLLQELV